MPAPVILWSTMLGCLVVALTALHNLASTSDASNVNAELATFGIKVNLGVSIFGFLFTYFAVPTLAQKFVAARLYGIDLNKGTTKRNEDGSLYRDPETNAIEGIKVPEVGERVRVNSNW